MNFRLRRRRFGQLAIASAATAAIGSLSKKTVAQTSLLLYGVRFDPKSQKVILQSLDLAKVLQAVGSATVAITDIINQISPVSITDLSEQASKVDARNDERVSSFTLLKDGTFVLVTTPQIPKRGRNPNLSRLSLGLQPFTALQLPENSSVESLIQTQDGTLLSTVSLNQGVPPFQLATVDRQSGAVSFSDELVIPPYLRLSNLAQTPDAKIYSTTLGPEGTTGLTQIDLVNKAIVTGKGQIINLPKLKFENHYLQNDVLSLVSSPTGELYVLADPTYQGVNFVFKVDATTGVLRLLAKFDVEKIAFARS